MYSKFWLIIVFLLIGYTEADVEITADNIESLAPVQTIDFADAPPEAGEIVNGWFALSDDSRLAAVTNRDGEVVIWDLGSAEVTTIYAVPGADGLLATPIEMRFSGQALYSLHSDGVSHYVHIYDGGAETTLRYPNDAETPLTVWKSADSPYIWLEVLPDPADLEGREFVAGLSPETGEIEIRLPGPTSDPDIDLRIGRVPPPFAVTASRDGLVKLWDLQTGTVLTTAQIDAVPIYGQIDGDASHLSWRDPQSVALHLLDFETGEDRIVENLNGTYIPFILLNRLANVVVGVYINDEPVIAAWDVDTGRRIDLGGYRTCSRAPDMVRLTSTSLVIGCDAGLQVWQVNVNGSES